MIGWGPQTVLIERIFLLCSLFGVSFIGVSTVFAAGKGLAYSIYSEMWKLKICVLFLCVKDTNGRRVVYARFSKLQLFCFFSKWPGSRLSIKKHGAFVKV